MRSIKPDKDILVSTIRIPTASGSIPALVLSPKAGAQNAAGILWIHGGGYIAGMKEMVHISRAVDLVKRFGAVVISPATGWPFSGHSRQQPRIAIRPWSI